MSSREHEPGLALFFGPTCRFLKERGRIQGARRHRAGRFLAAAAHQNECSFIAPGRWLVLCRYQLWHRDIYTVRKLMGWISIGSVARRLSCQHCAACFSQNNLPRSHSSLLPLYAFIVDPASLLQLAHHDAYVGLPPIDARQL
jgi:hypothetical protein